MNKAARALGLLLTDRRALAARLSWPLFSFASYTMTSSLARQGIIPKTIIDVGANIGQFAVASANIFPSARIYSIEPQPACVQLLNKHTRSLHNVEIFPFAIGDTSGVIDFHVNSHAHSSSVLPLDDQHRDAFPQATEMAVIEVPLRTLDEVLRGKELQGPVLLKLDIQGYESHALRGSVKVLEEVDYLLMEVSFKPMYRGELLFQEIAALAAGFGFRFLRPLDWLSHPVSGEILQMDALFARN